MSRYTIENEPPREICVGWDPPMGTFFAQEFPLPEPKDWDGQCIWWIGNEMREIKTLWEFEDLLRAHNVTLPPDVREKLIADEAAAWQPGPMQRYFGFLGKESEEA